MRLKRFIRYEYLAATIVPLLILLGLLLFPTDAVHAVYTVGTNVYAWDEAQPGYQNSNVVVTFNGQWVPFFHPVSSFNNNMYPQYYLSGDGLPAGAPLDPCYGTGVNTDTMYAGVMQWGLDHHDDNPMWAPGWQRTKFWRLVWCDRNGDGSFTTGGPTSDLRTPIPGTAGITEFVPVNLVGQNFAPLEIDQVISSTTGSSMNEIYTTLFVNLDTDCDYDLSDENIPPGGVCFYALAQTANGTNWAQTMQGYVSAGGGNRTVSFNPQSGSTAVTLASLVGGSSASAPYVAVLLALGVGGMVLLFWRARRRTLPPKR